MSTHSRGGRKMAVTPDGAAWTPRPQVDNALVRAVARAFRWRKMLDQGVCATIEELAKREKVNRGYRVLRHTLLAPDIVEAVLDGRQPEGMLSRHRQEFAHLGRWFLPLGRQERRTNEASENLSEKTLREVEQPPSA